MDETRLQSSSLARLRSSLNILLQLSTIVLASARETAQTFSLAGSPIHEVSPLSAKQAVTPCS